MTETEKSTCRFCDLKGRDPCGAKSAIGMLCTRRGGHYGCHAHCRGELDDPMDHPLLSWNRRRAESDIMVECLQRILAEEEPDSWVAEQICEALGAE